MVKPHIYYWEGYWRVSPAQKPFFAHRREWDAAHQHVRKLNNPPLDSTWGWDLTPRWYRGTNWHSYRRMEWATILRWKYLPYRVTVMGSRPNFNYL